MYLSFARVDSVALSTHVEYNQKNEISYRTKTMHRTDGTVTKIWVIRRILKIILIEWTVIDYPVEQWIITVEEQVMWVNLRRRMWVP